MPAEQLEAELNLDVSSSLDSVEALGSAIDASLTTAADSFSEAMTNAVGEVPDVEVAVDADTSEVEPAITGAVDAADGTIDIDAEGAETITGDIDAAVADADTEVAVEADTTAAVAAIEDLSASVPSIEIGVEADTEGASASLDELGTSAGGAGTQMSGATESADQLSGAASGLGAAGGLATGSWSALGTAVGSTTGTAGVAVGAIAAVAGATGLMFNEAVEATGASQRFAATLGSMADRVENLKNIPSLNTNLSDLALTLGSDDDKIRNVVARLFELSTSSGKSREEASLFTQQMVAMGARAVALNPQLGDVGDVTDGLSTALVRGGRFASKYGLDLNAAAINARALEMSNKTATAELSFVEKAMAGAAIASEKYGGNLATIVAQGSENAITKQRRLQQTIRESIEALGMPLVAPIFEVMESSIPVAEAMGRVIQTLATSALPALQSSFSVIVPVATALADVLELIGPIIGPLAAGFIAFEAVTALLPLVIGGVTTGLIGITTAAPAAAAAIHLSATAIEAAEVGISTALPVIGLIVGGLALAATAFGLFGSEAETSSVQVDGFSSALESANGKLDESTRKAARSLLEEQNQIKDLAKAGITLNQVLNATSKTSEDQRRVLEKLSGTTNELWVNQQDRGFAEAATLRAIRTEQAGYIAQLNEMNPALGKVVASTLASNEGNKGFIATLRELSGASAETNVKLEQRSATSASDAAISEQSAEATAAQTEAMKVQTQQIDAYVSAASSGLPTAASAFDTVKSAAENFGQAMSPEALLTGLQETLGQIVSFTNNLRTIFDAGFTDLGALMQSKGAEAGAATTQAIADAIRAGNPTVAQQLNDAAALVSVSGAVAAENASVSGSNVVANTDAQYARLAPLVRAYMGLTAEGVSVGGLDVSQAAGAAAVDATSNFTAGISPIPGTAGATLQGAAGAVRGQQGAVAGAAGGAGSQSAGQFAQGVGTIPGIAGSAVAGAGSQIAANGSTVAENQARGAGYGIGSSFGYGMQQGISDTIRGVREYARQMGVAAVQGAQAGVDGHSPSRETIKIGHDMGSGLVIGMADSESAVARAGVDLARAALSDVGGKAWSPFTPAVGHDGRGVAGVTGSTAIQFNIKVDGVADPTTARQVGEQVGEGAVDALMRRGVVVSARLG